MHPSSTMEGDEVEEAHQFPFLLFSLFFFLSFCFESIMVDPSHTFKWIFSPYRRLNDISNILYAWLSPCQVFYSLSGGAPSRHRRQTGVTVPPWSSMVSSGMVSFRLTVEQRRSAMGRCGLAWFCGISGFMRQGYVRDGVVAMLLVCFLADVGELNMG